LPASCAESAECLVGQRSVYEMYGVFSPRLIDGIVSRLRSFNDASLRQELGGDRDKIMEMVRRYFYCG